jgi:hypothetical protein
MFYSLAYRENDVGNGLHLIFKPPFVETEVLDEAAAAAD